MRGMEHLADHILSVAHDKELPVTNLQLQKVLFFCIGLSIKNDGCISDLIERTYDEPFEKWKFGPVVESLFYRFNKYKDKPISENGWYNCYYSDFDHMIHRLLQVNPFSLAKLSMSLNSWSIYESKIMNNEYVPPYTLEELHLDFNS